MPRSGEESVRVETGKQTVYPTLVSGGLVDLCQPHKKMIEGHSTLSNEIAREVGVPPEAVDASFPSHEGTCAECARRSKPGELTNQLDQLLPPRYREKQQESDTRPRRPFIPGQTPTRALPPLPQSLNALGDTTDWDEHYDTLPDTLHRGFAMKIPGKLYDLVHDPESHQGAVAKELVSRTAKRATGPHWSVRPEVAQDFAIRSGRTGSSDLPLVLHAAKPSQQDIETRPHMLRRMEIFDYGGGAHDEREVPVRKGRTLMVTGISWHPHHDHPAADEQGWIHHDFNEPMLHRASRDELSPLPEKLYHVTTARDAVLKHGLKTRDELGQQYGHGLGGAHDAAISLTSHKPTADHLLHSLHEYHDVLNGKITPDDLIDKAKSGIGAKEPFYDTVVGGNEYYERAKALEGDRTVAHGVHTLGEQPEGWTPAGESIGQHKDSGKPIHWEWTRPVTNRERIHARSDLYKSFTWGRQFASGHMNPLFAANDPVALAKKDPRQFALLHVRPRPGAQGTRMNSRSEGTDAGEWRTTSGKDLDVIHHEGLKDITPRTAAWDNPEPSMWDMDDEDGSYVEERRNKAKEWDDIHEGLGDIYRGVNVHLRPEDHEIVHNPNVPEHMRAQHLLKALQHSELGRGRENLGRHWTDNHGVAESFGEMDDRPNRHGWHPTSVVFHAHRPERDDIDEEPDQHDGDIYGFHEHGEREIPIRPGGNVHLKGVSWKDMNEPDSDYATAHGGGLFDHMFNYQHHDYGDDGPHHYAAKYPIKYTRMTQNGYEDVEDEIEGPLYHGSRSKRLRPGDLITKGRKTNPWGDQGPKSQMVHFTQHHDTARDYADQAGGHVYEIEPTGEFKHDYSPGDYKTVHPLRVVRMVPRSEWEQSKESSHKTGSDYLPWPVVKGPNGEPNEYPGNGITQARHSADMPAPLYHGTSAKFEPGDLIEPGHPSNFVRRMKHVYATESPEEARNYGWHGLGSDWDKTKGNEQERHPRVYEVRPTGPYGHRRDARGGNWASEEPWEVVREVWHHELKEAARRTAALENIDTSLGANPGVHPEDWFHGTSHRFTHFEPQHSSQYWHDPYDEPVDDDAYDHEPDEESHSALSGTGHWNTRLGTHFTADHGVAEQFASPDDKENGAQGRVIHARLHIKNPKKYHSEYDMDHEVHLDEHGRGNYITPHLASDDEYEDLLPDEQEAEAELHRGDDQRGPYESRHWQMGRNRPMATSWVNSHPDRDAIADRFKQKLIDQGHDGIVYRNEIEKGTGSRWTAVPFDPKQIEITHIHKPGAHHDPKQMSEFHKYYPAPGQHPLFEAIFKSSMLDIFMSAWEQSELFHAQPGPSQHSPKADWYRRMIEKHEPKPDEDDDEYEPDGCEQCGEDKNNEEEHAEAHHNWLTDQKWHTDWDSVDDLGGDRNELQRGIATSLPPDLHRFVHDESQPLHERGQALAKHIIKSTNDGGHLGRFWTDAPHVARSYAETTPVHNYDDKGTPKTPVMIHVHLPDRAHIETDPEELEHHGVFSYHLENNREVPLQHGTPLELKSISWAPPRPQYSKNQSSEADWKRHDLKEPIKAMSSLHKHAHDSGDSQRIFHCPFCGGGQVIGRSDGTTECEFCGTHFTVQVQPQFNSFPQTDPATGMPIQIPGMPGQIGDGSQMPPGAPGVPMEADGDDGAGFPPQDGSEDEVDAQEPPDDEDADNKPDFLKSKSYLTSNGDVLTEEQYVRHLAMLHADDREKMAVLLRNSQ